MCPRGVSTVARHAGGPARSSDESLVIGVERRGRAIRSWFVWSTGTKRSGRNFEERADVVRETVRDFEVGSLGGVRKSQSEQGSTGGRRGQPGRFREGSERQSVQDL